MKSLFIGQNAIHLLSVDSTNSYASEMLRQMRPMEGTLIYTFDQRNGRGQRGNSWESEANKNIALSVILNPNFLQADKQFYITKIVSLAIADLMSEMLKNSTYEECISIKWPNDIYIGEKKIAGVLIENTLRENNLQHSIIGIGININQEEFHSTKKATSVKQLLKEEQELLPVIEKLCTYLEAKYLQLKANKCGDIDEAYLRCLYQFEEWKKYSSSDIEFEGTIKGVSASGKLNIQLRNGEVKQYALKEINFI